MLWHVPLKGQRRQFDILAADKLALNRDSLSTDDRTETVRFTWLLSRTKSCVVLTNTI